MSRESKLIYATAQSLGIEACGDQQCVFGHPGGMGVNGRCDCVSYRACLCSLDNTPPDARLNGRRLSQVARALAERVLKLEEAARCVFAAQEAVDREAEGHASSRSSAPLVRLINANERLRKLLGEKGDGN